MKEGLFHEDIDQLLLLGVGVGLRTVFIMTGLAVDDYCARSFSVERTV